MSLCSLFWQCESVCSIIEARSYLCVKLPAFSVPIKTILNILFCSLFAVDFNIFYISEHHRNICVFEIVCTVHIPLSKLHLSLQWVALKFVHSLTKTKRATKTKRIDSSMYRTDLNDIENCSDFIWLLNRTNLHPNLSFVIGFNDVHFFSL